MQGAPMMPNLDLTTDAEYEAHSDAMALMRAAVINGDAARLKAAKAMAKKILKAQAAEKKALEAVAG
jgi:hypothetical protein